MGSTCTVLLINETSAVVAHVGDSRVYQLRGRTKIFRTFDHSMVFDLVKQKVITEEQARLSAQSNVITRALGIKPDIEVDITELPYDCGDRFLLTTDGIHGAVSERELLEKASDKKHALGTVTDEIATTIDGKGRNEGGGHDNLTLAIIETKTNSKLKSKMNKNTKFLLGAVSSLCLLSLVFNGVLLGRNNSSVSDGNKATQVSRTDSLVQIIQQKDSIIDKMTVDQLSSQTAAVNANDALNTTVKEQEKEIAKLNRQLHRKDSLNKELHRELGEWKSGKKTIVKRSGKIQKGQ